MNQPIPTKIKLLQKQRLLQITFDNGRHFVLPCEYLRVFSPSAEVRGHGAGELTLITGKQDVNIMAIEPVGNYAIKLIFDDGHNSGIYSWHVLYDLAINHETNWRHYQNRLRKEHQK